ncbi:MAG TPA: hypothetical protein VKE71_04195 [Candidatus Angelobacter sp.]|nr:hypothetical protein [Candidatus Angelobacter sp.]
MEILAAIIDFLFGCHHRRLSRVFTIENQTYRVCCNCGAKFKYSLASMRIESRLENAFNECSSHAGMKVHEKYDEGVVAAQRSAPV